MTMNLGKNMVRLRIIRTEEEDAARILSFRKQRREELLAEAAANPKPPPIRSRARRGLPVGGAGARPSR